MHPTPSTTASPVPRRPSFLSPPPPARADGPSPTKRRKVATSGPDSSASASSLRSSTPAEFAQLDAERRAASQRVLDVWSGLAEKYTRRLDEDDIVDLRTGDLVRDRGVLSGTTRIWDIGCFADAVEDSGGEPEDDSEDELAGWGSESEMHHQFKPVHVPPVQELDPEDAEDLRDFLAAEEARKAGGDEDDGSLDEPLDNDDGGDYDEDGVGTDDPDVEVYDPDTEGSVVDVEAGSALALSGEDSPDELDGYDDTVGEGALLWEVGSDQEDIGLERLSLEPVPPLRRFRTPAQLRTPPLSRSSEVPPRSSFTRPPLDLPPPELPSIASSKKKGKQPETEAQTISKPSSPRVKENTNAKERTAFATPTKNLVPEVVITSRRRTSIMTAPENEETPPKHRRRVPSTSSRPKKFPSPTKRRASTSSPSKPPHPQSDSPVLDAVSRDSLASPRRPGKRKRVLLEDVEKEEEEEVGHVLVPEDADEKVVVPHHRSHRRSSPHPPPPPSAPPTVSNFWPPYSRHGSVAPSYPGSFTPTHAPQPGPLDAQLIFAQAMQSLSYLVHAGPEGSRPGWAPPAPFPPPQPAHPPGPSHWQSPHSQQGPSHIPHPQHALSYASPPQQSSSHFPPQHTPSHMPPPQYTPPHAHPPPVHSSPHPFQQHPPPPLSWGYPPYHYPYTPGTHPHPQSPPTSSVSSFAPGPPSSPYSSPLSGKGKGKRVSFPDEWPPSEEDVESNEREEEVSPRMRGSPLKKVVHDSAESARHKTFGRRDSAGSIGSKKPSHNAVGSGSRTEPGPLRSKSKSRK